MLAFEKAGGRPGNLYTATGASVTASASVPICAQAASIENPSLHGR